MPYNGYQKHTIILMLGITLAFGGASLSMAQTSTAENYTDQQLKSAGWSDSQIADLRAMPPSPSDKGTQPDLDQSQPDSLGYVSVFDDYIPFEYVPDIDWREANDTVGRIGGWRSYAKQVQKARQQGKMDKEAGALK